MDKQELERLIEAGEYCVNKGESNCLDCPACTTKPKYCIRLIKKEDKLNNLKRLYELEYDKPKTDDEQLKRLIEGFKYCVMEDSDCDYCVLHGECKSTMISICELALPYLLDMAAQEIDTAKELTTGQMIDFLAENPAWTARDDKGDVLSFKDGVLTWINWSEEVGGEPFSIIYKSESKYVVMPPEPLEVDFEEAYIAYLNEDAEIQSTFDGEGYSLNPLKLRPLHLNNPSSDAIKSKWIILNGKEAEEGV